MLGLINDVSVTIGEAAVVKTATFELTASNSTFKAGEEFAATLRATSQVDEANLFSADIDFDPELLEVVNIDKSSSFVTQWASDSFNNATGKIKLTGGVPAPGFKTPELGSDMALINFKAKKAGNALVNFSGVSAIYRNSDNVDILKSTTPFLVEISPAATPTPTPTPSPTPTARPPQLQPRHLPQLQHQLLRPVQLLRLFGAQPVL